MWEFFHLDSLKLKVQRGRFPPPSSPASRVLSPDLVEDISGAVFSPSPLDNHQKCEKVAAAVLVFHFEEMQRWKKSSLTSFFCCCFGTQSRKAEIDDYLFHRLQTARGLTFTVCEFFATAKMGQFLHEDINNRRSKKAFETSDCPYVHSNPIWFGNRPPPSSAFID